MKSESRLAFQKSSQDSDRSAMVITCTPLLWKMLVERGRLYVRWEVCRVENFTIAICCAKCSLYGHNEKMWQQDNVTCSRCGVIGHKPEDCTADKQRYATCYHFGQKATDSHVTGARDCPARIHAERRMVESTNY
ncbi:unnamed protein product [Diatraea saccharalis]|uniref:CCHC-type domain-containing protein n=1 Tax=Diatraea saccharalis TaxID=40085 RepID=A0A9N9R6B7_9NEOP|nr:unnamed protein product [Diatraea saccharalis]